jgi:hypothetical protein
MAGSTSVMGRAGIEPATLGLKVRAKSLGRAARNRNRLQRARITPATSCTRLKAAETSPYSHRYSRTLAS